LAPQDAGDSYARNRCGVSGGQVNWILAEIETLTTPHLSGIVLKTGKNRNAFLEFLPDMKPEKGLGLEHLYTLERRIA